MAAYGSPQSMCGEDDMASEACTSPDVPKEAPEEENDSEKLCKLLLDAGHCVTRTPLSVSMCVTV
jgi:hypothetical protein